MTQPNPQDIVNQLLLSSPHNDLLLTLKCSVDICLQSTQIMQSQITKMEHEQRVERSKSVKDQKVQNESRYWMSSDTLLYVCDFLTYNEILKFRLADRNAILSLIGCPLNLNHWKLNETLMKTLNEIAQLRINRLIMTSSLNPSCNCIASRLFNATALEIPEKLHVCLFKYSKMASKYQFSPTISELKSIGYYQPWTVSHLSITHSLLDEEVNKIVEMKHVFNLKSLRTSSELNFPKSLLLNLEELHCENITQNFDVIFTLSNLRSITLLFSDASLELKSFTTLCQLEQLTLNGLTRVEGNLEVLSSFHQLKRLKIKYCYKLYGNISSLSYLDQLIEIDIFSDTLHIEGNLSSLSNLNKLKHLDIQCGDNNLIGDISSLSRLNCLSTLILCDNHSVSGDIQSLVSLSNLAEIDCWDTKLSGNLSSLSSLKKLKRLQASNTNIEGSLESLSSLVNLEELYLVNTHVTGDSYRLLGNCAVLNEMI